VRCKHTDSRLAFGPWKNNARTDRRGQFRCCAGHRDALPARCACGVL